MSFINRVVLVGNVCKDPEIRYAGPSQTPVCDLRLGVNRVWKSANGEKRQDSLFIDVVAWGRSAELSVQYLRKGRLVGAEGRLTMDEWTGPDGKKNSKIRITADRIIFLPSSAGNGRSGPAPSEEEDQASGSHPVEDRASVA